MNAEQNKCLGMFGAFFGHRFIPRYDTEEKLAECAEAVLSSAPQKTNVGLVVGALTGSEGLQNILEELKENKTTYVCDVCARCGATRQRGG